jgi:hypothetical protein
MALVQWVGAIGIILAAIVEIFFGNTSSEN